VDRHLKKGNLVVLRSTVKIGTTRQVVAPLLKNARVPFDLAFCPERTLEGQALKELRQLPQIVGGINAASAVRASQIFQFLTPTIVRVSDVETAETIKLIDNAHRDVLFSYSNEVARICDAVKISAVEVISAGKLGYPRTNLPMPGPVGGPCLEKDSHILAEGLKERGFEPKITLLSRRLNENQPEEIVQMLADVLNRQPGFPENPTITLMGLAFKGRPITDDLRGTMARPIFGSLKQHFPKARFRGFDAVVSPSDVKKFGLTFFPTLASAMKQAYLVLILNNHPIFSDMPLERLAESMARPSLVYDFWNNFSASALRMPPRRFYMALGSHGQATLL
jgi:nucleotide sugar dehydrogenase